MKRFVVTLSEEHRAKLEKYRAVHGLRSEADAIRHMIDRDFTAYAPADHPVVVRAQAAEKKPVAPYGSRLKKK